MDKNMDMSELGESIETNVDISNENTGFAFTGTAKEYFSIWIVNVLLTILTLGIYSAWAKVRTNQYFYGNTLLDGVSFRYLAEPLQILKGRAAAVVLFAAYYFSGLISPTAVVITIVIIMLMVPAFVVMSMAFQLRNSSYRNVQFNFKKDFKRAYFLFTVPVLFLAAYLSAVSIFQPEMMAQEQQQEMTTTLILISLLPLGIALLFPWWEYLLNQFKVSHASLGTANFSFLALTRSYYKLYIKGFLVAMLAGVGMTAVIALSGAAVGFMDIDSEASEGFAVISSIIFPLLIIPFYLWIFAYFQTRKTNLIYNNIEVSGHQLKSDLEVWDMFMLYLTNTLAMVVSLGLLMPWAKIRTARYRASKTSVDTNGSFDSFIAAQVQHQSSLGEGVGDVFDMDLGM